MFATYGWSHSLQEMGNILQACILISENSSIVILTVLLLWSFPCECVKSCIFVLRKKEKCAI